MSQHECGLDRTYCDSCGDELEAGLVGLCDSCMGTSDSENDSACADERQDDEVEDEAGEGGD